MKYTIRKAKKCDIPILLEISKRVTNHNNRKFLPKSMVDDFLNSEYFVSEIADYIDEIEVLLTTDEIIGMCRFEGNKLVSLMIEPEYQGTGTGRYFMEEMLRMKSIKYAEIVLECFDSNKRACKFYESIGFELVDISWDTDMKQDMRLYRYNY